MKNLKININPEVQKRIDSYPEKIRMKLNKLKALIIESAQELENIAVLEETLKWGEPSYLTKIGSTIRMDWKSKNPNQYAMYFQCTSRLVPTFKSVFGDLFSYEKTRAILFDLDGEFPEEELKSCIKAGLQYHKVKHLPFLGIIN